MSNNGGMKRIIYQVCLGDSKLYTWCINSVHNYCVRHGIDHKVQRDVRLGITPDPKTSNRSANSTAKFGCLPIFEKECAFELFPEYDQVAIIDSDVYVRETAPNVFDELKSDTDFAGVVEREMPCTRQYLQKIIAYSHGQYSPLRDVNWRYHPAGGHEFFNMGVMVMNKSFAKYLDGQTPKEFIRRPEFKRFVDGLGRWKWSTDQTLLNYFVRKSGMTLQHLNWKWNGLFRGIQDRHFNGAHFAHFFLKDKLPNRGEDIDIMQKVVAEDFTGIGGVYHA